MCRTHILPSAHSLPIFFPYELGGVEVTCTNNSATLRSFTPLYFSVLSVTLLLVDISSSHNPRARQPCFRIHSTPIKSIANGTLSCLTPNAEKTQSSRQKKKKEKKSSYQRSIFYTIASRSIRKLRKCLSHIHLWPTQPTHLHHQPQ